MRATITLSVDTDELRNRDDAHLVALWHAAQANPLPAHDHGAGELVKSIGFEIIRRWLNQAPALLHEHQADHHFWHVLFQHGDWSGPGQKWRPNATKMAQMAAAADTTRAGGVL